MDTQLLLDDAQKIIDEVSIPNAAAAPSTPAAPSTISYTTESAPTPSPTLTDTERATIRAKLYRLREELDSILKIIDGTSAAMPLDPILAPAAHLAPSHAAPTHYSNQRVVEGIFNGQKMIGSDGQEYHVPPNYASKSKLVEGDGMKLTITDNGAFIYKQINQTPRKRLVGDLVADMVTGQWSVVAGSKSYKILTASATFYRGKPGDEVVFLVPQTGDSQWGAVENIIHK